jgi:hypothetical protein
MPEDVPLAAIRSSWLQHDGAPANYGEDAQQWLKATYPGRCIGCGGSIAWSPRLRDATPVGAPERVRLCSPSRTYRIYCDRLTVRPFLGNG